MKKLMIVLPALFVTFYLEAAFTPPVKNMNAYSIRIPSGKNTYLSLMELSKIKSKDFEKISGKKMNWVQRILFKKVQNHLQKNNGKDGTFPNKIAATTPGKNPFKYNRRGFKLGLFGGLYGLIATFFINGGSRAENTNRIIWTVIGFMGFLLFLILILLLLFYVGAVPIIP